MGFGLMGLVPLLILGVIIWVVVEATRNRGSQQTPPPVYGPAAPHNYGIQAPQTPYTGPSSYPAQPHVPQAGALAILNERYARGEIDREEYLAKKTDLG